MLKVRQLHSQTESAHTRKIYFVFGWRPSHFSRAKIKPGFNDYPQEDGGCQFMDSEQLHQWPVFLGRKLNSLKINTMFLHLTFHSSCIKQEPPKRLLQVFSFPRHHNIFEELTCRLVCLLLAVLALPGIFHMVITAYRVCASVKKY